MSRDENNFIHPTNHGKPILKNSNPTRNKSNLAVGKALDVNDRLPRLTRRLLPALIALVFFSPHSHAGEAGQDDAIAAGNAKKIAGDNANSADAAPEEVQTLPAVTVVSGAEAETATGPVDGYVAKRSATATKTDTPLAETPQSISVITQERLEDQNVTDLGEALRYTPGIQGEPFGVEPRFTFLRIRGFDASTSGLFRDGLKLSNPGFALSYGLEPYGAERIEVLRGPASVLYGQASPGGLVNFVTKRPTLEPLREVGIELGNFDRKQTTFDFGGAVDEDGKLSYRLTGLVRDSDTQLDFVEDERTYIAPALTLRPSEDTTWTVLTHYQNDDTRSSQALPANGTLFRNPNGRIPLDRFTGEPGIDRYEREEYSVTSLFEHRFNDAVTFRQNARYYKTDLDDVSVFSSAVEADQRTVNRGFFGNFSELDSFTIDNQLQYQFSAGAFRHTVLGGLDYQHIDADSRQFFGAAPSIDIFNPVYGAAVTEPPPFKDDNITQRQIGVYLQDQINYERWALTLAGRYDDAKSETDSRLFNTGTEQSDHAFTGRAGLLYKFDNGFAPYVSYAESFLPALGTDASGKAFDPETGKQYEAGVKYQAPSSRSFLAVSLFELTREDYLQTDPATFFQVQNGEARSRGVEFEGLANLTTGLDLIFSYTYTDVEIIESTVAAEEGQRPSQTPEHFASLWADYTLQDGPLRGLGIGGGMRYLGSTFGDDLNTVKVPNVTLFDAAIHYDWEQLRLAVNALNVFDRDYVASAFVRGTDAFAVAGQERTLRATLTYRW